MSNRTITFTRGEAALILAALYHVADEGMRPRAAIEREFMDKARECGDLYDLTRSAVEKIFDAPIEPSKGPYEDWQFKAGGWGFC